MRGFIILCLTTLSWAAPEGYNYQQQLPTGSGASFQQFASVSQSGLGGVSNFFGAGGNQHQQQPFIFSSHGSGHGSGHGGNYLQPQQEVIVSKRFFIHSAPEENDEEYREKHITVGTPRKNYNVVFIRAPSKSSKKTAIKIIPAVNEDKTVIYVLSKKTDAADIHAEVQELPTSTAKPEVFFIKYKTPEEAAHAQEQIQAQYDSLGGSSQLTDEGVAPVTSVIGSLGHANVEHQAEQSGNFAQIQHGGNSNNGYLPPNFY